MTPKEKALELWWKYYDRIEHTLSEEYSPNESFIVKQCALIAVDEIINEYSNLPHFGELYLENIDYLEKVKQEIEKL